MHLSRLVVGVALVLAGLAAVIRVVDANDVAAGRVISTIKAGQGSWGVAIGR